MSTAPAIPYLTFPLTSGEVNDLALQQFLQSIVAGITAIPGNYVRPRWQAVVPNQPPPNVTWAAIGVVSRERETFTYEAHNSSDNTGAVSSNTVVRHQLLHVLVSFYGPAAEASAELLAMGLGLANNRSGLQLAGYGLVSVEDATAVPVMVNSQWLYGVDLPITLRRRQKYTYNVQEFAAAQLAVSIDNPVATYPISVAPKA